MCDLFYNRVALLRGTYEIFTSFQLKNASLIVFGS